MSKYLVGIDAGHGLNTAGKRTPNLQRDLYIDGKLVRKIWIYGCTKRS